MAIKHPCYLELSPNKDLLKIVHKSGMIVANLVIYDPKFAERLLSAYDRLGLMTIPRPETPFFGEIFEVPEIEVLEELARQITVRSNYGQNLDDCLKAVEFEKENSK